MSESFSRLALLETGLASLRWTTAVDDPNGCGLPEGKPFRKFVIWPLLFLENELDW